MADEIYPISHTEKVIAGLVEPISHTEKVIAKYGTGGSGGSGGSGSSGGSGTDELVKMDSTTDAKYLSELIDKQTIVNDGGVLKVKKLDGQEVTIAEINRLKGLTMNVMDLVNAFANGGVKVLNTPVATHADLSTLDRSTFTNGIYYIVYVLADETHGGAKTTYLCDKTNETFFGNADSQRNFITDPIDLANEVTGKLGTSNINVDALWKLLTINDTYKTLTTKNEPFGTHGAKALYNELVADIGKKANATDLTTTQSLEYEGENVTCENTLASRTLGMLIKGKTYQNASKIESAGEKENKISILSKNKESADDNNYKQDKKEILLPIDGGLKCLPNGVADTIEQRNDGVYLVQRVGKVVLNGSESWTKSSWSMTNTFKFDFEIGLVAKLFDINATNQILCDTFKVVSRNSLDNVANREFESICPSNSRSRTLSITISKTKLNNTNTTGTFKQWLRNNPVTVCYELETPVETKLNINDLDLEVYKDITYVTTDNAIKPTLSFKVPSNIGGVIQSNAQNINKLYKLSDEVDNKVDKTSILSAISNTPSDDNLLSEKAIKSELDKLKTNFEDGVDTVYDAVVARGTTPIDKTPSEIANAISKLGGDLTSIYNALTNKGLSMSGTENEDQIASIITDLMTIKSFTTQTDNTTFVFNGTKDAIKDTELVDTSSGLILEITNKELTSVESGGYIEFAEINKAEYNNRLKFV